MKRKKEYTFRKGLIKSIIGISTKLDDSLDGLKREVMLLIVKFFMFLFSLGLFVYSLIVTNILQIVIFTILMLSTFLSWYAQIGRYRKIKALRELKMLRGSK